MTPEISTVLSAKKIGPGNIRSGDQHGSQRRLPIILQPQLSELYFGNGVFGFLMVAFDQFQPRGGGQGAANGGDGRFLAGQQTQIVRRDSGGVENEVRPPG